MTFLVVAGLIGKAPLFLLSTIFFFCSHSNVLILSLSCVQAGKAAPRVLSPEEQEEYDQFQKNQARSPSKFVFCMIV